MVGDFNTTSDSKSISDAIQNSTIDDAIELANIDNDPKRIDWILTKGFKVLNGQMIEKGISDHPYYQVELALDN